MPQYDKEKLTLTIVNDHYLTGAGLSGQLDQILGSGNYTFNIKDHYESLSDDISCEAINNSYYDEALGVEVVPVTIEGDPERKDCKA